MKRNMNFTYLNLVIIFIVAQISCNTGIKHELTPYKTDSIKITTLSTQNITQNSNREIIPQLSTIPPLNENFAVFFSNIPCGINPEWILDTSKKTLRYQPLGDENIIELTWDLMQVEKEIIYEYAIEIDYFSYPSEYKSEIINCATTPHQYYELAIKNGDNENKVSWTDETQMCDNTEKSNQLRKLVKIIHSFIVEKAFYLKLPPPSALCL